MSKSQITPISSPERIEIPDVLRRGLGKHYNTAFRKAALTTAFFLRIQTGAPNRTAEKVAGGVWR